MEETKKFKLSEPTQEEKENFMKEFDTLVKKCSMYVEAVPVYSRIEGTTKFETTAQLFIQKATEIVEVEKVEGAVPSTNPEVNPTI